MNLTSFTDYSLRIMIMLGSNPDKKFKTNELTEYLGIKLNHATKIIHKLASLNYIHSFKGRNGGISINKNSYRLNLSDIVLELEPMNIVECFAAGNIDCSLLPSCKLKSILNMAKNDFINKLAEHTLLDICNISEENLDNLF